MTRYIEVSRENWPNFIGNRSVDEIATHGAHEFWTRYMANISPIDMYPAEINLP